MRPPRYLQLLNTEQAQRIAAGMVDIYLVSFASQTERLAELRQLLSTEELERARRFVKVRHRQNYLLTRALVHLPRNSYTLLVVAQTNTLR
jgi:hypothetical protein